MCETRAIPFAIQWSLLKGIHLNPTYSVVRLPDSRQSTVFTSDLAPYPPAHNDSEDPPNTNPFPESDDLGDDMGDVAADVADGVRGEEKNDALFQRTWSVTVNRLCRAGLPVGANPLIGMVLMSVQFEWERLWRFVCCCLAVLMSLSRNFYCCHNSSRQLAFVFHSGCRAGSAVVAITCS